MHDIYRFVTGPLAWVAFLVFIIGSLYRVISLIQLTRKKEPFIFTYMSWKYSLRSIFHWLTPFGTENWKRHPALTIVTFAFHICLFITPICLMAHVIMWEEAWSLSWWTLGDGAADVMTVIVLVGCVFFLGRRLFLPEVQFVTSGSDYLLLLVVAAPFITGFLAYHQLTSYPVMMILHVVSGEIMLMAIPFTRLAHMLLSPLTRAYMGSEFGKIRHAKDW
jgi:nitrate reductase gamma subunit